MDHFSIQNDGQLEISYKQYKEQRERDKYAKVVVFTGFTLWSSQGDHLRQLLHMFLVLQE